MRLRIHGHYRIDAHGRLVRLADVNDPGLTYASPLPRLVFDPPRRPSLPRIAFIELSVIASIVAILIGLILTIVPLVRRAPRKPPLGRRLSITKRCRPRRPRRPPRAEHPSSLWIRRTPRIWCTIGTSGISIGMVMKPKPVLRYAEKPDRAAKTSGSSAYLRDRLGL